MKPIPASLNLEPPSDRALHGVAAAMCIPNTDIATCRRGIHTCGVEEEDE